MLIFLQVAEMSMEVGSWIPDPLVVGRTWRLLIGVFLLRWCWSDRMIGRDSVRRIFVQLVGPRSRCLLIVAGLRSG